MAAPKASNQKAAEPKTVADKKKAAAGKQQKGPAKTEGEDFNYIVRMANSDIDGQKHVVIGLQSIKGVGKRVAQIIVKKSGLDGSAKIGSLSDEQIKDLEKLVIDYVQYAPSWAVNRQMDYETGADMHLIGQDLGIMQDDDINRMKMIRNYRGVRHDTHHKVRGQRTRSNGRKGLAVGVQKKSDAKAASAAPKTQ
ncbi:MAG: 30S ribosomal protein S13 [Candidatus Methanomethylophilus sp.]|jgi:small subunit ribosomal protein S13|uniref:30S ribosomal protein S13 n=1 Tax=Candidatus Methanomethylophilus sp. 1R26 TaxID=1769296 RepID=UPI0009EB8288|nr:30S ribosomal protein S13 [Candidatus Methanomethylophilus sp. 1R26]MCH3977518.1 30S ribosomal protein S13 [Methanomethylophilus sp.]WII09895.1 30S ribosomal protein S13 [Methanomassiliicoccales archaeon LGM-DZ1]MCI2075297.1 30S ribosomal protein S13 [Methanomethylophilus sp.]MCI2092639.1 30S ribosomal protein S13 [Methanomethylophilus sp.]MEE3400446.1 30S ribosomal protein S13 [Methanomethylophilus sp.]